MGRYDTIKKRVNEQNNNTSSVNSSKTSSGSTLGTDRYSFVKNKVKTNGTSYSDINEDYLTTFQSDVSRGIEDTKTLYSNISYSNRNDTRDQYNQTWKSLNDRANYLRSYVNSQRDDTNKTGYEELISYLDSLDSAYNTFNKAFNDSEKYYSQWATEDDYNSYMSKLAEDFEQYKYQNKENAKANADYVSAVNVAKNSPDFDEYSEKGAAIKNPSKWQADGGLNIFGWMPFAKDVENKVTYTRDNYSRLIEGSSKSGMNSRYNFMTEDEVSVYNYYLAKENEGLIPEGSSNEFLNTLMPYLDARAGEKLYNVTGLDDDSSIVSKFAFNLAAGAVGNVLNFGQFLDVGKDNSIDYRSENSFNTALNYSTQTESDSKIRSGSLKLAGILGAMIPSILVSKGVGAAAGGFTTAAKAKKIGEIAGNAELGIAAATAEYNQSINEGNSVAFSLAKGAVVGLWEGITEYKLGSIEGLANNKILGAFDKFSEGVEGKIKNALAKAVVRTANTLLDDVEEGIEEVIQGAGEDIINAIFSGEILDGNIQWTDSEEVWENFLYGALSAVVMNGYSKGKNAIITSIGEVNSAFEISKDEKRLEALKNTGKSFAANTVAYQIADKVDESTGAFTIAKLLHNVNAELSEQNRADIAYQLQKNGLSEKDSKSYASWLSDAVNGEEFTSKQQRILENNPIVSSVFKQVIIDSNSTVNQRLSSLAMSVSGSTNQYGVDLSKLSEVGNRESVSKSVNSSMKAQRDLGLDYNTLTSEKRKDRKIVADAFQKSTVGKSMLNDRMLNTAEGRSTDTFLNEKVANAIEDTVRASKSMSSYEMAETLKNAQKNVEDSVSNSDATILKSTGEDVNIKKIESIQNGKMVLELDNGQKVDSSDISYDTLENAIVYETIAKAGYSVDDANAIVQMFKANDVPANKFMLGVNEAFKYGMITDNESIIPNNGLAADLPASVRSEAFKLGRERSMKNIQSKQKSVDARKKSGAKKAGKVVYAKSAKGADLSERQNASVKTIDKVVSMLDSVNVVFYASKDGKLQDDIAGRKAGDKAQHGAYTKDGTIYIDINAGVNYEGVMLYTFSHELLHHLANTNPTQYKALADFIMNEYGKAGVSIDSLIKEKMHTFDLSFEDAFEEVIADTMQPMFTDADLASKIAKLKAKDAGLFEQVKQFFVDLYNKIKELYKGTDPYTREGQLIKRMSDSMEKISNMFAEGLVSTDAGALDESDNSGVKFSFSSIGYTFFGDENISSEDFEKGNYKEQKGYKDYVNNCLSVFMQTHKGVTKKDALAEIVDSIDGIVRVAVASKKAGYDILDDSGKRDIKDSKGRLLFSSLEPNSDYFTSHDISTICDKRKNFAQIYDDIIKREAELGVPAEKSFFNNVDNYFYIHKVLADKGLTQPCRQCYVESMRKNLMPMAKAFLQLINEKDANNKKNPQLYQPSGKNKGNLKETNAKLRERFLEELDNYGMSLNDITAETLTTADGLAELKITAPLLYEAFNSFYGQSKPKMPKAATPFRFGELTALLTDNNGNIRNSVVDKINSTGGFRLQSYSDYQIVNYVDVLQVLFEAGTLGLNGHAYTKVPAFLDATEGTNLKRNISIFMYQDGSEWKLDRNDSFPAPTIEDIYSIVNADKSGNTSIIAVSQNAEMSAYIMANDNIGYGIPFHKSGLKMDTVRQTIVKEGGREIKGYSKIKDHTKQQTEVWASSNADHKAFTKVKNGINIYGKDVNWDFENKKGLTKNELIKKNLMSYIDACYDKGYLPKFREYLMNNEAVLNNVLMYAKKLGYVSADATIDDISFKYRGFTIPYGYYKFLGDFGMFTPDGKASPHDTLSLKNYDFDKAVELFGNSEQLRRNEILQQFSNGEERQKYRNSSLTAEELNDIVQQKRSEVVDEIVGRNAKLSDRDVEILDAKYELNPEVKYSERVTDKKLINFLENQEHITTYKAMLLVDGKLYPPMASKVKDESGKYVMSNPRVVGEWMQATEDASNIKSFNAEGVGYYELKKENGGTVKAAYNPYEHSSNLVLNDQFESAYNRPNIVTVKCEIPVSEMTSGYKAEHAKDSVGYLDWHSGVVAGKLKDSKRKVYLSRYLKVVEIMDDSEVARLYKETLGDSDIAVPFNVVTPSLRSELEKIGVKIDYNGTPMYQSLQSRKANSNGAKFSIREEAKKEIQDVLDMNPREDEIRLTDSSPTILLNQKGVKNYPLVMKPSHIRENILTEDEARQKGLATDGTVNYHGLGITKFVDVINGLDDVDEAYRGTKNASNPQRREKYFLLISKETDGVNRINVPVFINETTREAEIYTISNKIATVFGRNNLDEYLKREIKKGNLVRVKKKSTILGESPTPIVGHYGNNALSDSKLSQNESDVNSKFSDRDSEGNTLTKAQQEYFKDSKVRDSEGNLLVMYHGTGADFTEFDRNFIGKTGAFEGAGFNFTPSEGRAESYGGRVMSGYINVTRPLSFDGVTMNARGLAKIIEKLDPTGDDIIANYARDTRDYGTPSFVKREALTTARAVLQYAENDVDVYSDLSASSGGNVSLIEGFEELGYDGVIHYNDDGSIKTVITFNSNQFKNVDNTTPTTNADIRFSDRDASYTEERIDRIIREYGSSNPNYAQAYVATISPRDFLKLTIRDEVLEKWNNAEGNNREIYALDRERLAENTQTPFLSIEDGEVIGHEGRHRMRAMMNAGIERVPVIIKELSTKYSKKKTPSMSIKSQDFGYGNVNGEYIAAVTNLIPTNNVYRDDIISSYGKDSELKFSDRDGSWGNGYDGYSMSNNARRAYEEGEMPISKWKKSDIIDRAREIDSAKADLLEKVNLKTLKDELLTQTSWHHTSEYYNKTDFYSFDEERLKNLSVSDIKKLATQKETKAAGDEFRGDIEYLEWGGTRNHPKATKHELKDVNIEKRGSFYIVTDDSGKELIRKKIDSNGTKVTNYEAVERAKKAEAEMLERIKANSSSEAYELYSDMMKNGYESSWSGNIYRRGRKPSSWDVERGLSEFFKVGEKRLSQNKNGGYDVNTWNGTGWDVENGVKSSERDESLLAQQREVNKQLEEENEILRKDNEDLKQLVELQKKVTGGTIITKSSIESIAGTIMNQSDVHTKGNKQEFVKLLEDSYNYILRSENIDFNEFKAKADKAVEWLMDNKSKNYGLSEDAEDLFSYLKGKTIYISPAQREEINSQYGNFNDFRSALMGRVNFTFEKTKGIAIDSLFSEAADMYPNLFDAEISDVEMPSRLRDIVTEMKEGSKRQLDREYAYYRKMDEQEAFERIYDGYWKISTLKTVADKYQNQINRLKGKHIEQMQNLREKHKAKDAELRKRYMQEKQDALNAYKEKAQAQQRQIVEKYRESRQNAIIGRNKTALRHQIKGVVNELNQYLLSGTKEKHVMIGMQKAVAEALNAVNFDTVDAQSRIEKYDKLIAEATNPEVKKSLIETRNRIEQMGDKMDDKLTKLKNAYDEIINSNDPMIANSYDDVIASKIQETIEIVGNTSLRSMELEQLNAVYDMYKMVLTSVRNANKLFMDGKKYEVSVLGNRTIAELDMLKKRDKLTSKTKDLIEKFEWNNLKPVYAFKQIGSQTLMELFDKVRNAEDVWAKDVSEARDFFVRESEKYNASEWNNKKTYEFQSTSGKKFTLNLQQIMSLYAFSKREQARDHIRRGGIVIDEQTVTKKGLKNYISTDATAYNISDATLDEIINSLTEEQRKYVDEMQEYLSTTLGSKGNEVSLELYGVKLFGEKFYFPLRSAQQYMPKAKEQAQGEGKIKNAGFSKTTKAHASNPIILSEFDTVWASHADEMSRYHSFVIPLEDFYKVYNYRTPVDEKLASDAVNAYIENTSGKGATQYIEQLLRDLNGGTRTDNTAGVINKFLSLFKKGAVMGSASVVIQQPSAIARVLPYIELKYFIGEKVTKGKAWEEAKQYAPVAVIKEMGGYDTHTGQSTLDYITNNSSAGVLSKFDDLLGKAPELADQITWCAIWQAAKRKAKATTNLTGEALLQKAGEIFTEAIVNTQVYDSVLSRSGNMRSKDGLMKMATAFMAEPTTSINIVSDAINDLKKGNRKQAVAKVAGVVSSVILNSLLVGFVYAARDDDDDETYWEKYISSTVSNILEGVNPATYVPFVKDVYSEVQGYTTKRTDISVLSDLIKAIKNFDKAISSDAKDAKAIRSASVDLTNQVAMLFGIPTKNLTRDYRAFVNTWGIATTGEKPTNTGTKLAIREGITEGSVIAGRLMGDNPNNGMQAYKAIMEGDSEHLARVKARYDTEDKYHSAIRKALQTDKRVIDAAKARNDGNTSLYTSLAKEVIANGFAQDDVVSAINSIINSLNKGDEVETETTHKAKALYSMDDFTDALISGDMAMTNAIKSEIERIAVQNGKSEEEAEKSFKTSASTAIRDGYDFGNLTEEEAIDALIEYCGKTEDEATSKVSQWKFELENGYAYSDKDDAYKSGQITRDELIKVLMQNGKTREDAEMQAEIYDWQMEGFDITDNQKSVITDYHDYCEGYGIDKKTYYNAYLFYRDSGNGEAYSKTKETIPYIDSLPLNNYQKNQLALCWWSQKTIDQYKTWK